MRIVCLLNSCCPLANLTSLTSIYRLRIACMPYENLLLSAAASLDGFFVP